MAIKQILLIIFLSRSNIIFCQDFAATSLSKFQGVFKEIKLATKSEKQLWNKDIYAPILLVNPKTRQVIANDYSPKLKRLHGLYVGCLPKNINIANTAIKWNEKRWAMIILPLPKNRYDRINLIAHELFHRYQKELGFKPEDPINSHLDKLDGRIYLILELEALKKALKASDNKEQTTHLFNALEFRKYRHLLFPGADSTENYLELNEGLTEYTGFMIAKRPKETALKHFVSDINIFIDNSSFVRNFPLYTIPIYGYFLYKTDKNWNKEIKSQTNLTEFFINKFNFQKPKLAISTIANNYGYSKIYQKEHLREDAIERKITNYKIQFVNNPTLKLSFEKMNLSFNPSNIIPLENLGTVYPTIRVTDKWGILNVTEGALVSPQWDYIVVSNLVKTDGRIFKGKGWTLTLNKDYRISKVNGSENYIVEKIK